NAVCKVPFFLNNIFYFVFSENKQFFIKPALKVRDVVRVLKDIFRLLIFEIFGSPSSVLPAF
ncbi:hypothetical protein, partial [Treponema porcinum]|uniref:hypothetical protein n=1 Tax=Treponema porcinum TaxID=261392 RepID=UPI0023557988